MTWSFARRAKRAAMKSARSDTFPRRSPLLSLGQHLGLDVGEDAVYWARSKPGPDGLRLLEWGRVPIPEDESAELVLQRIARTSWVRVARVEVPIRSPDLRHKRVSMPPLTPAAARKVAQRRVAELLGEQGDACIGSFMRVRRTGSHPLWLVAISKEAPALFEHRWQSLGFDVHRLSSEPLALGNLARLLAPQPSGELTAIFDLHQDGGDCVICDDHGWHFNRVIPIRQARTWGGPADAASNDKAQGLSVAQMERVATELQRTFQYVERELQLGRVTRVALAGECPDLESLADHLATSLAVRVRPIGDLIPSGPARGMNAAAARAVGLAMAPDRRGCSLLPAESKDRHRAKRARLQLSSSLAVASLAAGVSVLDLGLEAYTMKRRTARMREQLAAAADRAQIVADVVQVRERARELQLALENMHRAEPAWDGWLELLGRSLPANVAIEELEAARSGDGWSATMRLEARGEGVSEAAEAVVALRARLAHQGLWVISSADRDAVRPTVQDAAGARVFFELKGELAVLESPWDVALDPPSTMGSTSPAIGAAAAQDEAAGSESSHASD